MSTLRGRPLFGSLEKQSRTFTRNKEHLIELDVLKTAEDTGGSYGRADQWIASRATMWRTSAKPSSVTFDANRELPELQLKLQCPELRTQPSLPLPNLHHHRHVLRYRPHPGSTVSRPSWRTVTPSPSQPSRPGKHLMREHVCRQC
jgi:hypothetical protein